MDSDRQFVLGDHLQVRAIEQLPHLVHAAGVVVLQRKDTQLGITLLDRADHVGKAREADRLLAGYEAEAGFMAEGAGDPMIGDAHSIDAPSERMSPTKSGKLVAIMAALSTVTGRSAARPITRKLIAIR